MEQEKNESEKLQEISLEQLEDASGGLLFFDPSIITRSSTSIAFSGSSYFRPARPRLMNALPADLIELVDSLEGESEK